MYIIQNLHFMHMESHVSHIELDTLILPSLINTTTAPDVCCVVIYRKFAPLMTQFVVTIKGWCIIVKSSLVISFMSWLSP